MQVIEVKDLVGGYGQVNILEGLNVSIPKGKITIIIGPNGCGKSTLLKHIARILKPKQGTIQLNGQNMGNMHPKEIAKMMAFLPQSPMTPAGLLVKELVSFGRFPYQKPFAGLNKEDLEIINWSLHKTGVYDVNDKQVDELSGGQRQRVWIAMALAQKTDIVLLDEPTTYLDIAYQLEVLELLRELNQNHQKTIVIVLHELNFACRFADHIIGMKYGHIVFEGTPNEVITSEHLKELYGIHVELQLSSDQQYPICVDYQTIREH